LKVFKSLKRFLSRHVTVLVIPHADFPVLRGRLSASFLLFCLFFWSGLTVWAGFIAGRHVDYWITKADNAVIRSKMHYMADEMEKSREMLEMAHATDKQLRILLGMGERDAILKSETGLGGPSAAERMGLSSLLANPSRLPQPKIRDTARSLRAESERRLASYQEIAWYVANQRNLRDATPNIYPADGRITSGFGYRFSPFQRGDGLHRGQFHEGIDIANKPDTPIAAAGDGTVRYAGWKGGFGMVVLIDHGYGLSTLYGHASKVTVKTGESIARGQLIGYMGTTGRSTGSHLHYEVWRHGKPVNPLKYLEGRPRRPKPAG
jgi:murein DD-endopeptidase MepM/ murein hydrolase activator NlpD